MAAIQTICLFLLAGYLVTRARLEARPAVLFRRYALVAAAAWLTEDTCLRAYGFREYNQSLWLFLDRVPVLVVLLWPAVVQSSRDLATCLWPGRDRPSAPRVALTAAALVLADAALLEPVAVHSALWQWTTPGLLGVPPVALLGPAAFAGLTVFAFERAAWQFRPWQEAFALLLAPAGAHTLVVAAYWALFRWVPIPVPPLAAPLLAWPIGLLVTAHALRRRASIRVPPALLWIRLPAALVCLALVLLNPRDSLPLIVYSVAFVPPFVAILRLPARGPA